jgi:hypothetical protein
VTVGWVVVGIGNLAVGIAKGEGVEVLFGSVFIVLGLLWAVLFTGPTDRAS